MRSEHKQSNKVQIRIGPIVHESYLFFSRELGDLILEPGDEVILVARNKKPGYWATNAIFPENRKGIFNKIRKHLITQEATHRLANKEFNAFDCLKEAIIKYKYLRKQKIGEDKNENNRKI